MAASSRTTSKPRNNVTYQHLRDRAKKIKKAQCLLAAGKSLREAAEETGISKSALGRMAANKFVDEDYHTPAQRERIVIRVLKYVHRELLKKPRQYYRRPSKSNKTNYKIVSYKEVTKYLKKNWRTAHPDGQEGLLNESWIPKERNYYYLVGKIPSWSTDRARVSLRSQS